MSSMKVLTTPELYSYLLTPRLTSVSQSWRPPQPRASALQPTLPFCSRFDAFLIRQFYSDKYIICLLRKFCSANKASYCNICHGSLLFLTYHIRKLLMPFLPIWRLLTDLSSRLTPPSNPHPSLVKPRSNVAYPSLTLLLEPTKIRWGTVRYYD